MKKLDVYYLDKVAKTLEFSLFNNRFRIGIWNTFPLFNPFCFRNTHPKFKGWQIDFLWFSLAAKAKEREPV
jgi:hypothetical protein